MQLKDYIPNVNRKYAKIFFSGISFDSSKVKKDHIFFAIKGSKFDGNHRVIKTWSDKSGNIGAVYIIVSPQKYASTETADRTFENKRTFQ